MELSLIPEQDKEKFIGQSLGISSTSPEDMVAELLRSELTARGVSGRRNLCDRILQLMQPPVVVTRDLVKEVLFSLEKAGDISAGPNGQIAATPLRAVKLAENRYQIFGSMPHGQLVNFFSKSKLSAGLTRILNLKGDDRKKIKETLEALAGLELTPERWAGMDKVGAADKSWLNGLNNRLISQPVSSGSFDQQTRDEWQVYQPDKAKLLQKARWHKNKKSSKGNLWRIWHERGWPIYCWTVGDSPETSEQIRLSADEANRTMFALDKLKDAIISCKITKKRNKTDVQIGGFLPKEEYRYLITKGNFTGKDGDYFCFQFRNTVWEECADLLTKRLGIPG